MLTDILLIVVGVLVGAMNAIAGGGMLVGFPVLLAVGLPAITANATAYLIILPGQITSVIGYRKYLRSIPWRYMLLLIPCLVGAAIGANLLRHTPPSKFEEIIPGLIAGAVALFIFQPFLHRQLHKHMTTRSKRTGPLFWIGLATFPLAIYGGYFGAGFGFVMLAFLGFTKLHEVHQMQALKNISSAAIALASVIVLFQGSFIDWHHGLFMAAGTTLGGYAGARLSLRLSSHAVRIVIIVIGICTAAYIALR